MATINQRLSFKNKGEAETKQNLVVSERIKLKIDLGKKRESKKRRLETDGLAQEVRRAWKARVQHSQVGTIKGPGFVNLKCCLDLART